MKRALTILGLFSTYFISLAAPRLIDESNEPSMPLPLAVFLIIILAILLGIAYFKFTNADGTKENSYGCLFLIAVTGAIIGIIILCA